MQMHIIDAIVKGVLFGLFMAISVGPTLFAVLKYSLNHSYKTGLAFVLGVSFSDIMYVTIANLAASWLVMLQGYEKQIAYGGAAILIAVGLTTLLKKYKPKRPSATLPTITGGHYFRIWMSGFLINTVNPGAIITWLGAASVTINSPLLYRVVLFGCCLGIVLFFDFMKVFLADLIRRSLTVRRVMYLHKFSGICILFLGVALLISTFFNIQFKKPEPKKPLSAIQTHSFISFDKA